MAVGKGGAGDAIDALTGDALRGDALTGDGCEFAALVHARASHSAQTPTALSVECSLTYSTALCVLQVSHVEYLTVEMTVD